MWDIDDDEQNIQSRKRHILHSPKLVFKSSIVFDWLAYYIVLHSPTILLKTIGNAYEQIWLYVE